MWLAIAWLLKDMSTYYSCCYYLSSIYKEDTTGNRVDMKQASFLLLAESGLALTKLLHFPAQSRQETAWLWGGRSLGPSAPLCTIGLLCRGGEQIAALGYWQCGGETDKNNLNIVVCTSPGVCAGEEQRGERRWKSTWGSLESVGESRWGLLHEQYCWCLPGLVAWYRQRGLLPPVRFRESEYPHCCQPSFTLNPLWCFT